MNLSWFDHDANARNDEKCVRIRLQFGMEGIGTLWDMVELVSSADNGFIDRQLIPVYLPYCKAEIITWILDESGIFFEEKGKISASRIQERVKKVKRLKRNGSKGGRPKSAEGQQVKSKPNGYADGLAKENQKGGQQGNHSISISPSISYSLSNSSKEGDLKGENGEEIGYIPTLNSVQEYFVREGGTMQDAERFYNRWAAYNWLDNGQKFKWMYKARNWIIGKRQDSGADDKAARMERLQKKIDARGRN